MMISPLFPQGTDLALLDLVKEKSKGILTEINFFPVDNYKDDKQRVLVSCNCMSGQIVYVQATFEKESNIEETANQIVRGLIKRAKIPKNKLLILGIQKKIRGSIYG